MAGATRERVLAASLLREQRMRSARARDLLRGSEEMSALPGRERGFVTRLVLGVVRTSGALDQAIDAHLRHGAHLEPKVRDALRVATYELLYLGTPARVAVSQGVELARRANRRTAGLANAVLRRVVQDDVPRVRDARQRLEAGPVGADDAALAGGLPPWLAERLASSLPAEDLRQLALTLDDPAPVYVAANAAHGDAVRAERLMREAGIAFSPGPLAGCYVVDGGGALARSGLVSTVDLVPADLGAQAVVRAVAPVPGSLVLEVGQGRGTKSILLENAAIDAGGPCEIGAVDSEGFKVRIAQRRMRRAGLADHVRAWELDARRLGLADAPRELRQPFDLVFVDAPCSGTGTMRRHPEIPWSLDEASTRDGGSLPALQVGILSASARCVRLGGRLAYATCSLLPEEDEGVVQAFLASPEGESFAVDSPAEAPAGRVTPEGFLRTLSFDPSADGHFLAVLKRLA